MSARATAEVLTDAGTFYLEVSGIGTKTLHVQATDRDNHVDKFDFKLKKAPSKKADVAEINALTDAGLEAARRVRASRATDG